MKVILLRDVAKIGKRYEIVSVPDGFAQNKLIPKGDAESATPINVKRVMNIRHKDSSGKEKVLVALKKIIDDLAGASLEIPMQSNELGHLFKSVHVDDVIASALKRGLTIPKEFISFASPIKSIGNHQVTLKNQGEVFMLEIKVIAK